MDRISDLLRLGEKNQGLFKSLEHAQRINDSIFRSSLTADLTRGLFDSLRNGSLKDFAMRMDAVCAPFRQMQSSPFARFMDGMQQHFQMVDRINERLAAKIFPVFDALRSASLTPMPPLSLLPPVQIPPIVPRDALREEVKQLEARVEELEAQLNPPPPPESPDDPDVHTGQYL